MKILSFILDSTKFSWLLVEGTTSAPLVLLPLKRSKFPDDVGLGSGLSTMQKTVGLLLDTEKPDIVVILQAGHSKFGGPSAARIKAEAILQLSAAERGIPTHMIAPVTLAAKQKRLKADGTNAADILNGGHPFSPKETEDAALSAWLKLPNE